MIDCHRKECGQSLVNFSKFWEMTDDTGVSEMVQDKDIAMKV